MFNRARTHDRDEAAPSRALPARSAIVPAVIPDGAMAILASSATSTVLRRADGTTGRLPLAPDVAAGIQQSVGRGESLPPEPRAILQHHPCNARAATSATATRTALRLTPSIPRTHPRTRLH